LVPYFLSLCCCSVFNELETSALIKTLDDYSRSDFFVNTFLGFFLYN